MMQIIENGGFSTGGFNFDAKLRRQSVDVNDLYLAHITGIDTLARALLGAADVLKAAQLKRLCQERYQAWNSELGRSIDAGQYTLSALADHAVESGFDPKPRSGRQEFAESLIANCCTH
jgi:xylose isomerase